MTLIFNFIRICASTRFPHSSFQNGRNTIHLIKSNYSILGYLKRKPYATYLPYSLPYRYHLRTSSVSGVIEKCYTRKLSSQSTKNIKGKPDEKDEVKKQELPDGEQLSTKVRFKRAVKEYGATLIVFHVSISLVSLGVCYLAISNGVDAIGLLNAFSFPESVITNKIAVGGSTFVMSYAVHKCFAPARMIITMTAVPFIVKYLRKIKFLKPVK